MNDGIHVQEDQVSVERIPQMAHHENTPITVVNINKARDTYLSE